MQYHSLSTILAISLTIISIFMMSTLPDILPFNLLSHLNVYFFVLTPVATKYRVFSIVATEEPALVIRCEVSGRPLPTVTLLRNQTVLIPGGRVKIEYRRLSNASIMAVEMHNHFLIYVPFASGGRRDLCLHWVK